MDEHQELWREYSRVRDNARRERLVLIYLPLVKVLAGRLKQTLPHSVQLADLESAGVRGLIQSVESYDLERGVRFSSFACARIRGAMLDSLREYDWLPRSLRSKVKSIERAQETCEVRLGCTPEDADIAEQMGLSIAEYRQLQAEVGALQMVSLDEISESAEGTNSFHEIIPDRQAADPQLNVEKEELRQRLREWLLALPDTARKIMILYYYEDLTMKEIGYLLNLSESRICQIHSAAVQALRQRLTNEVVL
ncbi:MAG: FliA/WhiG family RNA polymerase sigma factor [bacterium]